MATAAVEEDLGVLEDLGAQLGLLRPRAAVNELASSAPTGASGEAAGVSPGRPALGALRPTACRT